MSNSLPPLPTGHARPRRAARPSASAALHDLTAAAVVSLAAVSFYISAASLLFQGALAPHLPLAIGSALLGGAVLAMAAAWRGSMPLASVGAVPITVPVLAAITASVAAQASPAALLPTAVVTLALTNAAIGAAWWWMGRRGGGDVIRHIPYPVIGGFLGSTGWLVLVGSLGVASGTALHWDRLPAWLAQHADARLATTLALGALLGWCSRRSTHVLVLPGLIVGAALAIHAGLRAAGLDLAAASAQGWLLPPFHQALPAWPGAPALLLAVQWDVVAQQAGLIAAAVIVATIGLLLADTSLEVAWEQRADINRDLRVLGQGNLLSAALGGLSGGVSISRSMLNRAAGATGRGSGVTKAAICLVALGWGGPLFALMPRPVLAAVLFYQGLDTLKTWVVDSRHHLPRRDHLTVLVMVGITAAWGFLPAVCVGVLACCVDLAVSSARLSPVRRMVARSAWPSSVERSAAQVEFLQSVSQGLRIVELQGVLFFGSTTRLVAQIEALLHGGSPPQRLLFDFQHVRWLDTSAAQSLGRLFKQAGRQGVVVELSHLAGTPRRALKVAGCLGAGGPVLRADIDEAVCAWDDTALAGAGAGGLHDAALQDWLAESMAPEVAAQVLGHFEPLALDAGAVLFRQGEPADALYLVQSGRLAAVVKIGGQERAVRTINPGGAVGEMGLFRATPRSATVRAELPSTLLGLSAQRLQALEREQPALAAALYRLFLRQLAGRLEQSTAQAHALSV